MDNLNNKTKKEERKRDEKKKRFGSNYIKNPLKPNL